MTGGVGQRRVPSAFMAQTMIPMPPLAEQRRIVGKIEELFSELDRGVERLKEAREQLKAYRQALLKHAFEGKLTADWRRKHGRVAQSTEQLLSFAAKARDERYERELGSWRKAVCDWQDHGEAGKKPTKPTPAGKMEPVTPEEVASLPVQPETWSYVRLSTIAEIGSGMSVSKDRAVVDPVEVKYLRVANVQRGRLDLSRLTTMCVERSQVPQLALRMWDVLFNEGGDRDKLGRGWIWEEQVTPCITQNHVFRASLYRTSEEHSKLISHWGNTYGQEYFDTEGKQTTNLASINKSVLGAFPVPLVPDAEVRELVTRLECALASLDALDAEVERALEQTVALRQSILKQAFSGQLVPQDPNDEPASVLLERIRAEREQGSVEPKKKRVARKERVG